MNNQEYTEAVDEFAQTIFRIAYSYCKNRCDAEDVVQNVFLKLLKNEPKFNDKEHLKKWLIRVAANEAKNSYASFWKTRIVPLEEFDSDRTEDFPNETSSKLFEAIHKLKEKYRIVVHLYYYEDYSTKEIASILDIKETTVQTRLMRARGKLKDLLKEDWDYEQ